MDSVRPIASPITSPPGSSIAYQPPQPPAPEPGAAPDRIVRSGASFAGDIGCVARSSFDFMLGDDLVNVLGNGRSLQQRALGMLSLSSNFVPIGKAVGVGVKAVAHLGAGLGANSLVHVAAMLGGPATKTILANAVHEQTSAALRSVVRYVGGAFASLDLKAIEIGFTGKPHTLAKHVAKDLAYLKDRILKGKSTASTYVDLATAQRAADAVIAAGENQVRIQKWVDRGMPLTLTLESTIPGKPLGAVLTRADVNAGRTGTLTNSAMVVLKADAKSPTNYTILTTYPIVR